SGPAELPLWHRERRAGRARHRSAGPDPRVPPRVVPSGPARDARRPDDSAALRVREPCGSLPASTLAEPATLVTVHETDGNQGFILRRTRMSRTLAEARPGS